MRFGLLLILCPLFAFAGTADDDWKNLTGLDSGPGKQPTSAQEARDLSLGHLVVQEKALRAFMAEHGEDERAFDARLRLARLLSLRADLKQEEDPAEVEKLLGEADAAAKSPEQRTNFDFARLAQVMRHWQGKRPTPEERAEALTAVRKFQKAHPDGNRTASALLEVASVFEHDPTTKTSLLRDAARVATDAAVKAQIADDLKRLTYLGRSLQLRFTDLEGVKWEVADWKGKVVVVLFFATIAEPSKDAFIKLQNVTATFGDVVLVGISLDGDRAPLVKFLKERKFAGPILWDGKGWSGPLIEALGLNAVPAAWILDKKGMLRSLDILDDPAAAIRKLK